MDSFQFVFDYVHQDALDGTGELAENPHFFTMNNDHGECMTECTNGHSIKVSYQSAFVGPKPSPWP